MKRPAGITVPCGGDPGSFKDPVDPRAAAVVKPKTNHRLMKTSSGIAIIAFSLFLTSFKLIYSIDDVASAMRTGNAAQISKYFDSRVDLSFPDKSDTYSKSQAEMILKDFFATNQVKGFQIKHTGDNKDGSQFCIGLLQTKSRDYRTRFYLRKKGEQQFLQEIVFQLAE